MRILCCVLPLSSAQFSPGMIFKVFNNLQAPPTPLPTEPNINRLVAEYELGMGVVHKVLEGGRGRRAGN